MATKIFFIALSLFCLVGCDLNITQHNYLDAIEVARDFFEKSFIQNDVDKAYSLFGDALKSQITASELKGIIYQVHQGRLPTAFQVDAFSTYSGKETISIFLSTLNYEPKLYYRITLDGTKRKGYLVSGFHVSPNEVPAKDNKIYLKEKVIIENF